MVQFKVALGRYLNSLLLLLCWCIFYVAITISFDPWRKADWLFWSNFRSQTGLYIISDPTSFSAGQCHAQSHKKQKERITVENNGKVRSLDFSDEICLLAPRWSDI